jgi:hypothetical protein
MAIRSISTSTLKNDNPRYSRASGDFDQTFNQIVYLVIAGGGGAGNAGGAGGYRSSVPGEPSGGGAGAETPLPLTAGTYPVIVGAGGACCPSGGNRAPNGNNSRFADIIATGGGGGAGGFGTSGGDGGSGGGAASSGSSNFSPGGVPVPKQGYNGGSRPSTVGPFGGGGGAGDQGNAFGQQGRGGDGVASSITGTSIYRAGGGGSPIGLGGGTANAGGGGSGNTAGGPGRVFIRLSKFVPVSFSAGCSVTTHSLGVFNVYEVTATSTTSETVTIG